MVFAFVFKEMCFGENPKKEKEKMGVTFHVFLSDETTRWCLKSILLWNIRDVAWGDCSLVEKYVKTMSVHTD